MIIKIKHIFFKIPFWLPDLATYILYSIIYLNYFKKWVKTISPDFVISREELYNFFNNGIVNYYEFGVADGKSFKYWVKNNHHIDSRFVGYDTFEGLPERWGIYGKGEMASEIPQLNDSRVEFRKGLFQDTLGMIDTNPKIVHLDADLYSSTLFVLYTMRWAKGDIIIFDDFNVMPHVFRAFWDWGDSNKINYKVLLATKNYSEVAVILA